MKTRVAAALLVTVALSVFPAWADGHERIVEVWTCKLSEGKTQDDVQAANKKWVKLVNDNVEGGDVHSYVLTHLVGETDTFLYADSFPSLEAWMAMKKVMQSEEGQALEAELNAIATCSSNALHRSTES